MHLSCVMPEIAIPQIAPILLSVAVPAWNESAGLVEVVHTWQNYLRSVPAVADFEIVICNDGSTDETGAILNQLATADTRVRAVHHSKNQGAAAALTTAIQNTIYPWVLLIDADGQYGIDNLGRFLEALAQTDQKAAIGVRVSKHDSVFARFGSWLSGSLCNLFHGTRYRDFNCALKLVDGGVLRSLTLEAKGLNYSGEISSKLLERGIPLVEVEVDHRERTSGRSSAQNFKAASHRLMFVFYIGVRQFLLRRQVLQIRNMTKIRK